MALSPKERVRMGNLIRQLRTDSGLTQKGLASLTYTDQSCISDYELGSGDLSSRRALEVLWKLVKQPADVEAIVRLIATVPALDQEAYCALLISQAKEAGYLRSHALTREIAKISGLSFSQVELRLKKEL